MSDLVLLDNDVALKISCYSLVDEFFATTRSGASSTSMLGVGKYVIRNRVDRTSKIVDRDRARRAVEYLLSSISLIEPSDNELEAAAALEAKATMQGLELDSGESQLLAIMAHRGHELLITGDKRAIKAMAIVAIEASSNRVACLEQLFGWMIAACTLDQIRGAVCKEPSVDQAITICFGCSQCSSVDFNVAEALSSYIRHLDGEAPGVLRHSTKYPKISDATDTTAPG
ncbi:hypothetical protein [Brevundimonas diminuta]|uniref:hypothetical protein n=1 Tax=Brevundimonas diminuta TaxID=293 RepID=UPI003D065873